MYLFLTATLDGRYYCFSILQIRKMKHGRLNSLPQITELENSWAGIQWESVPLMPSFLSHSQLCLLLIVFCNYQKIYYMKDCCNTFYFKKWGKEFWIYFFKKCKRSLSWAIPSSYSIPDFPLTIHRESQWQPHKPYSGHYLLRAGCGCFQGWQISLCSP